MNQCLQYCNRKKKKQKKKHILGHCLIEKTQHIHWMVFIRIELNFYPKTSFNHIQIYTYYDSFCSHWEPSSDCDLDFVMSGDLDCLAPGRLPVANKGLQLPPRPNSPQPLPISHLCPLLINGQPQQNNPTLHPWQNMPQLTPTWHTPVPPSNPSPPPPPQHTHTILCQTPFPCLGLIALQSNPQPQHRTHHTTSQAPHTPPLTPSPPPTQPDMDQGAPKSPSVRGWIVLLGLSESSITWSV